jgi:hypothetical protein
MPFPCGQKWEGQTRKKHNPRLSIDFSRKNGYRDTVVASASGKVKKIGNLGNRSYGKYVYIDHGNGWETRYAHLSNISVKKGQRLSDLSARVKTYPQLLQNVEVKSKEGWEQNEAIQSAIPVDNNEEAYL